MSPWLFIWILLLSEVTAPPRGRAQAAATPPKPADEPYVLHVYEDLVQVPTLVLTSAHESYSGLPAKGFEVQLDGGPKFHPQAARTEGDDPLSIVLLLDARRGEDQDLVRSMAVAMDTLPAELVAAKDHISIFAYDCSLISSVVDVPASATAWRSGVVTALRAPGLHGRPDGRPHCAQPVHLWDAVSAVASQARTLPGRRVLIVVSGGEDSGSKIPFDSARGAATSMGLTIFGVQPPLPQRPVLGGGVSSKLSNETAMSDAFGALCGGTGGLLAGSDADQSGQTLKRIIELVRERYILEFPRPRNGQVGSHRIDISVASPSAIVRISGVSVAVQDPSQRSDAHTVPEDTSKAPVFGQAHH